MRSYKNRGRGWGPANFAYLRAPSRKRICSISANLSALGVSALSFSSSSLSYLPLSLNANALIRRRGIRLREPERKRGRSMRLIMLQPLAPFRQRWRMPGRNPPQPIIRLRRLLKPFRAIPKHFDVVRAVRKLAQRRKRLPHRDVHDHKWVIAMRDIRSVAQFRLQPPNKSRRRIRQRIDRLELQYESRDLRVVQRRKQSLDINLCQVIVHSRLPG